MKKIQAVTLLLPWLTLIPAAMGQTTVFINKIHYDNMGTDTGAAIEVAGPAGTDLTGWSLMIYNGSTGNMYNTTLSGVLADAGNGFGFDVTPYPANGKKMIHLTASRSSMQATQLFGFYPMKAPHPSAL